MEGAELRGQGIRRAVGDDQVTLHRLELRGDGLDERNEQVGYANQLGLAVVDDIGTVFHGHPWIDLQEHCPQPGDGIEELSEAVGIEIQDPHPVSGTDAQLLQGVGQATYTAVAFQVIVTQHAPVQVAGGDLHLAIGPGCVPQNGGNVELVTVVRGGRKSLHDLVTHSATSFSLSGKEIPRHPC
jgi:hypothetical protein